MKEKVKFYIILSAFLVTLFVWWIFIYLPQIEENNNILARIKSNIELQKSEDEVDLKLKKLDAGIKQIKIFIDSLESRIIRENEIEKIDSIFISEFSHFSMRMLEVSPSIKYILKDDPGKIKRRTYILPLKIVFETSYAALTKWFDQMDQMPFIFHPQVLKIKSRSFNSSILEVEMGINLVINRKDS